MKLYFSTVRHTQLAIKPNFAGPTTTEPAVLPPPVKPETEPVEPVRHPSRENPLPPPETQPSRTQPQCPPGTEPLRTC